MKRTIKLSKLNPVHAQPRRRHNAPLMESLLLALTIFLSFSLLIMMMINFAKDYVSSLHLFPAKDDSWQHVHYHGDIKVTQKLEGKNANLQYNTFRFKYKTDLPFDAVVDYLNNPIHVTEWFAWTVVTSPDHEEEDDHDHGLVMQNEDTIRHILVKIPYLQRHNRELVFNVSNEIVTMAQPEEHGKEGQMKKATYTYMNDKTSPSQCDNCKRSTFDLVMTILSNEDKKDTSDIEMTLYMDLSLNMFPSFIMNQLAVEWGIVSLYKLRKICRASLGLADTVETKISFYNIFPLKR